MPAGCFGYTVSRNNADGSFDCSKAQLANVNSSKIEAFTSDEQFLLAASSYGEMQEAWLVPNTHEGEVSQMFTITATVASASEGQGLVYGGGEYRAGASVTLSAMPNSGYEFDEWSDHDQNPVRTFVATENVTLEAKFTAQKYDLNVSVDASGGGTVSPSGTSRKAAGEQVLLEATASPGYSFARWSDDNTQAMRQYTMPAHNVSLVAYFEAE